MTDHTVKSYDDELTHLVNLIARMGGCAESQLASALEALGRRDGELAGRVVAGDARIDELEHEVQNFTVRLLALRQPVAGDLRLIVSSLKISSELERIGDYAANVAKRVMVLNQLPSVGRLSGVVQLGQAVQLLLKTVLDAFVERDLDKGMTVWGCDEEVDDLYTGLFRELVTYMMEDPRTIGACTHLLFIAKNIERIGDHATNIAEMLHFLVRGKPLTDSRPKGHTADAG